LVLVNEIQEGACLMNLNPFFTPWFNFLCALGFFTPDWRRYADEHLWDGEPEFDDASGEFVTMPSRFESFSKEFEDILRAG
jgi:hypothetical protein